MRNSMSEENPFRTLGFNPRVFKNLHDVEIFSLVKTQYRALMQIHHPDVNRRRNAESTSTAISLAFAKVNFENNPASFSYWKEAFLKSDRGKRGQSQSLSADTELSQARESSLQELAIECLKAVYLKVPSRPIALPAPIATVNDGCAMLLEDNTKRAWLSRLDSEGHSKRYPHIPMTPQDKVLEEMESGVDPTYYEVEATREGSLVYRRLVINKLRSKDVSPDARSAWVKRDSRGIGYYWTTLPEKTRVVKARIVGTIDQNRLRRFWDETGSATSRTISSGLTAEETSVIESTGYTTDQVRPYLWLLRPELRVGNVVVSMAPTGDKFLFLGRLFLIADESKAPRL